MKPAIAAATLAAGVLSGLLPASATDPRVTPHNAANNITRHVIRTVELGVDVETAALTSDSARKFLAGLKPDTRRLVLSGCRHYLERPERALLPETIRFCRLAL